MTETSGSGTAVQKALAILDVLEAGPVGGMPLSEIASTAKLPRPTAHRLLAELEVHGHVKRVDAGRYALGPRLISLGNMASANSSLNMVSGPVLDRLVEECGETIHVGVLQGDLMLYVDRREPTTAVRLATLPSPLSSLHASACGKILLAYADEELAQRVLKKPLPTYTATTVSDPDMLRREFEAIRESGYAINNQERFTGVRAVGVPVRRRNGTVIAAISIAGPVHRITDDRIPLLRAQLGRAANELTSLLP